MKLAFFPGTFNPVHKAHLEIAQIATKQCALDKVFFVLSPSPPNKLNQPAIMPVLQRAELLQKALVPYKADFELDLIELKEEGPSYTIKTIDYFMEKFALKPKELNFILGLDTFLNLPSWKEANKIKTLCNFLVAPRDKLLKTDNLNDFYRDLSFEILKNSLIDISASQIRSDKKQNNLDLSLLPTTIAKIYRDL